MLPDWLQFFPEILKYGATGLSALLFFFAYLLLREQSKKKDSDLKVLKEIRIYMFISVFLAVISLFSSLFCSPEESTSAELFWMKGKVINEDGHVPTGVTIITGSPPFTPDESDGKIDGLQVWRDPHGELPILSFNASGYFSKRVVLKDYEDQIQDSTIDIGEIELIKEEE